MKVLVLFICICLCLANAKSFYTAPYVGTPFTYVNTIPFTPQAFPTFRTAATPISTYPFVFNRYHTQDRNGAYTFSYSGGPSSRTESRDQFGNVVGAFNYVDPEGKIQTQQYVADSRGFRVAGTNLPVEPYVNVRDNKIRTKRDTTPVGKTPASTVPLKTGFGFPYSYASGVVPQAYTGGVAPQAYTGAVVPTTYTAGVVPTTYTGGVVPTTYTSGVVPTTYTGGVVPTTYTGGVVPTTYTGGVVPQTYFSGVTPQFVPNVLANRNVIPNFYQTPQFPWTPFPFTSFAPGSNVPTGVATTETRTSEKFTDGTKPVQPTVYSGVNTPWYNYNPGYFTGEYKTQKTPYSGFTYFY